MGMPPYLVLLRVGFTESRCHHRDWCALTAPFHPYQTRCTAVIRSVHGPGGLFSVALSLGSPPLDVIQHPALRSPDFPPPTWATGSDHLASFILKRLALFSGPPSCLVVESGRLGGQYLADVLMRVGPTLRGGTTSVKSQRQRKLVCRRPCPLRSEWWMGF